MSGMSDQQIAAHIDRLAYVRSTHGKTAKEAVGARMGVKLFLTPI
jgi:hypothetical protein